jgi:hypothetical protein
MQPQKGHKDPAKHKLMREKVVQVRKRGYILPGKVVGGTHYFCVDKRADDIRMVYNGTSCGLNEVLWAPRFRLPTVNQTLRALLPGYCQCDLDVGRGSSLVQPKLVGVLSHESKKTRILNSSENKRRRTTTTTRTTTVPPPKST